MYTYTYTYIFKVCGHCPRTELHCLWVCLTCSRPCTTAASAGEWMTQLMDAGWPASLRCFQWSSLPREVACKCNTKCDPSLRRSTPRSAEPLLRPFEATRREPGLAAQRHSGIHSFSYGFIDQWLARGDATCQKQLGRCHGFPHSSFILKRLWELCR